MEHHKAKRYVRPNVMCGLPIKKDFLYFRTAHRAELPDSVASRGGLHFQRNPPGLRVVTQRAQKSSKN